MHFSKLILFTLILFLLGVINNLNAQQITSVHVNGVSFFTEEKILLLTKSRWFSNVDSSQAKDDCNSIKQFYQEAGFLEVSCQYAVEYNEKNKKYSLIFNIEEGPLYRFGDIEISGLSSIQAHLMAHLVKFSSGMPFSKTKIVQSQLYAMQTGLFENFEIKAQHVDFFEKTISVVINIEEKLTYALDVGLGVDSEDGAKIFSGWKYRNINGKGRSVALDGLLAADYDEVIYFKKARVGFKMSEPFFLELPLDAGLNANYTTDKPKFVNFGFKSYAAELVFNIPVSFEYEIFLKGRLQNAQIFNIPFDQEIHSFQNPLQTDNNRFLSFTISRDTRDDLVDPSRGSFFSLTLEKAGGILGGDNDYNKIDFIGSYYRIIHRRFVCAQQLAIGNIDLNGDITSLPSYLRFFLGGTGSVRGFTQRSIGPRNEDGSAAGGNFLLLGNLEIRYYLNYNLNIVTFFDAGNVWLKSSAATLSSLKFSTGLGLRLRSRFGFFRIDFGIRLSDFSTKKIGRIHFGFGQNF